MLPCLSGIESKTGLYSSLEGSALPLGPYDLADIVLMETSVVKQRCRVESVTNPVEDSRVLKQYHSICSGELHKHRLKKMVLRGLLSHVENWNV